MIGFTNMLAKTVALTFPLAMAGVTLWVSAPIFHVIFLKQAGAFIAHSKAHDVAGAAIAALEAYITVASMIAMTLIAYFTGLKTTPALLRLATGVPMAVAMTVCRAEADVGADIFGGCMHKAIPELPPAWPAPQASATN
ncbi:MAG: hypothetical protein ACJ8AW_15170 [Rhodopila sp.]